MFFSAFFSRLEAHLFYRWQTGEAGAGRALGRLFWNLHYLRQFGLLDLPEAEHATTPSRDPLLPDLARLATSAAVPPSSLAELLQDEDNRLYAARQLRNTLHKTLQHIEAEIEALRAQKRQTNHHPHAAAAHSFSKGTNGFHVPSAAARGKAMHE